MIRSVNIEQRLYLQAIASTISICYGLKVCNWVILVTTYKPKAFLCDEIGTDKVEMVIYTNKAKTCNRILGL